MRGAKKPAPSGGAGIRVPKRVLAVIFMVFAIFVWPAVSPEFSKLMGWRGKKSVRARDLRPPGSDSSLHGAAASPSPLPKKRLAVIVLCRESDVGDLVKTVRSFQAAYLGEEEVTALLAARGGTTTDGGTAVVPVKAGEAAARTGGRAQTRAYDLIVFSETPWSEAARSTLSSASAMPVRWDWLVEGDGAWATPHWINATRFTAILKERSYYGNSESYRRMCRFFAGPVWLRPLVQEYDWVWRLDSHVRYLCDLPQDPVAVLEASPGAKYGYALVMTELMYTIPSLWRTVMDHARSIGKAEHVRQAWGVDPDRESSRGCHYWNNMEVAKVSFFSGPEYQSLFSTLDKSGGFFYERWGDAPIRSWALLVLAKPEEVKWFDIGYQHPWWVKCPSDGTCPGRGACTPDPEISPQQPTDGRMCKVGE